MPSNGVQQIASVLQKMIVSYYQDVRRQALLAFSAALALEVVAVIFFVYAASLTMNGNDQKKATLCAVAGLLIQVMTGIVFFLYSQSAKQFGGFHICLALQLPFPKISESMGNHDSKIVDAGSVD